MTTPTDTNTDPGTPQEWVLRWEDPATADHPVIPKLRERAEQVEAGLVDGTAWGVVQEHVVNAMFGPLLSDATRACYLHPRVELQMQWSTVYARYLSEAEYDRHLAQQMEAAGAAGEEPRDSHPDSL